MHSLVAAFHLTTNHTTPQFNPSGLGISTNFLNETNNNSSLLTTSAFVEQSLGNDTDVTYFDSYAQNGGEGAFNELIANISSVTYEFGTKLVTTAINGIITNATRTTPTASNSPPVVPPVTLSNSDFNSKNSAEYDSEALLLNQWLFNVTNSTNEAVTELAGSIEIVNDLASAGIGAVDAAFTNVSHITSLDYYNEDMDDVESQPCHPANPNFNCTENEFVQFLLGPQMLPLYKVLLVTVIFGGIFITGMLGNILICVVIVRHPTMHTATNYYLFSLALSDLIYLLFGLPAEIFLYWHQYPYLFGLPFCKIRAFISEASTYVSVLTIVAFSMERFLAICHPLHLYAMSGFKRAVRIITALWIVSFISAIPFGLLTDIQYVNYPLNDTRIPESAFCNMVHYPDNFPLFELSFCVFFVIPMILIIVLYGKMGAQIRFSTTLPLGVQQGSMHRESRHQQSRKAVIRMLAAVVITFFVCWLPFHMQRLWFLYARNYKYFQEINEWMFSITGFTYYVSCTINPILYNVMSHRYRVAFKDILSGKRRSVYYSNGFARDQSSFRETTIASSLGAGNNAAYDRLHSMRVRSIRRVTNTTDRHSFKSNNTLRKKPDCALPPKKEAPENSAKLNTNVVVVVDNGDINGRPKVYAANDAEASLMSKDNETCI